MGPSPRNPRITCARTERRLVFKMGKALSDCLERMEELRSTSDPRAERMLRFVSPKCEWMGPGMKAFDELFKRQVVHCTGKAGDVYIANYMTAHLVAPNTSSDIRYACYFRFKATSTMKTGRSSALLQLAAVAGVFYLGQWAFVGGRGDSAKITRTLRRGGGESVPTGLVWPSPEAEEKLREVDGIKLYPTHAWKDDMNPILDSSVKLEEWMGGIEARTALGTPSLPDRSVDVKDKPVIVGVAADSGCGKSTFLRRILGALGTERHTAIGEMMTVICLDDYHTNDRAGRKATGLTALDARENDFDLMGVQIEALKKGKAVYKPIYNHDTGNKDPPELIEPNKVMVFEGLHPIYDEKARAQLDLAIYIDIVQRDVAERGWTEEQVREDIEKRLPDFSKYVDPQKANADVVLRYEPSDQGLPFLKVKLIQKKDRKKHLWRLL
eukprot:g24568.t1